MFPAMSSRKLSKRTYKLAVIASERRGCGRAFSIAAVTDIPHCGLSALTPEWAAKRTAHSWRSHGFPPSRSMLVQKLLVRVDARLTVDARRVRHRHPIRNRRRVGGNGSGRWGCVPIGRIRIHALLCVRVRLCVRAHGFSVSRSGHCVRRNAIVTCCCRVGSSCDRRHWLRHRRSVGHSCGRACASNGSSALGDAYGSQQTQQHSANDQLLHTYLPLVRCFDLRPAKCVIFWWTTTTATVRPQLGLQRGCQSGKYRKQ